MKKSKLFVDFEYDFELLGISSSVKFHKLSWAINNHLNIKLVKQEDYLLDETSTDSGGILNFLFTDDSCEFQIFRNKSPDNDKLYILPEMSHYDYVIKINGQFQTFAVQEVLKQLREVKYIEYIAAIPLERIKSKDNFLN